MILPIKSLEKLRLLINEETQYRSGPQLVQFFNELGLTIHMGKDSHQEDITQMKDWRKSMALQN